MHELLPLHGLQDGVVGGQVRQLHEREHVEQVAPRRRDQVRLGGVGRGQQRAREARHEVEQLPRQRVREDGGEALQRVGRVQGGQLRDLLQGVVGAVQGAGGHLRGVSRTPCWSWLSSCTQEPYPCGDGDGEYRDDAGDDVADDTMSSGNMSMFRLQSKILTELPVLDAAMANGFQYWI